MTFATCVAACYSVSNETAPVRAKNALKQKDRASVLTRSDSKRLSKNRGDVCAAKSVGVDNMSSKLSGSGAKTDVNRGLRVGVSGAGVMGSNHARVLAGLPGVTLVGIVDPLAEHRSRATEFAGCPAFEKLDELLAEGVDAVTIAPWPASST